MNLPFFIARRYLVRQKGTFAAFIIRLAIVATALSVAVMIAAIAIIAGFKYTIREKMYSFMGNVHVVMHDVSQSNTLTSEPITIDNVLLTGIKNISHVTSVFPFAQRPTIIRTHGQMEGVQLKGVDSSYHFASGVSLAGHAINFNDTGYSKQLIISQTTADRLNLHVGDSVELYFLEPGATFPRIRKVVLSGIYHSGLEEIDKMYGICDIRLLQRVNNWQSNQINGYQVNLDDERYADSVSNYIFYKLLPQTSQLDAYTLRQIMSNIFDWIDLQNVNVRIILIIMAIVAIINLATAVVILIVEQARMIGILKTLGMAARRLQEVFLYHAGLIAFTGILLGNIFALTICWLQQRFGFMKLDEESYYMKQVPIRIYWWQIGLIDFSTLVLCILCMWLPTLFIRRVNPARVLQFK